MCGIFQNPVPLPLTIAWSVAAWSGVEAPGAGWCTLGASVLAPVRGRGAPKHTATPPPKLLAPSLLTKHNYRNTAFLHNELFVQVTFSDLSRII